MNRMVYIYVLKLQKNKYYVGKTTNPQFRIETHFKTGGSAFTKRYKPIQVLEIRQDCTDHDEQRVTQEYMAKYGIQDVRGGPWSQILLSDAQEECIQQILNSESDACYTCGEQGHFVNECPQGKQGTEVMETSKDVWSCEFCGKGFDSKKGCSYHENVHCSKRRAKSTNRMYNSSPKRYYDPGDDLWDELNATDSDSDSDEEVSCYRCGHEGHYATTCYAKRNINGYLIRR